MTEDLSQCHSGRLLGKSLYMDYNTGLNINISGSCLGKKKIGSDTMVILLVNMDKEYFSLPAMKAPFESI